MSNVKNLPLDIIGNIIDYILGVTTSTINGDWIGYYYIKINDIRLQYYEKTEYGYKFRVIDSIPDLKKRRTHPQCFRNLGRRAILYNAYK